MKTHTSDFKNKIKEFGRELDSKITFTIDDTTTELGNENLNSVSPHYEGAILKSVMKQLDIDSNVEIPVGTELNYQFGVKTRSGKNLFNKDTAESGTFYDTTDGHVISSSVWSQSDYIETNNITKLTISSGYNVVNNSYELTQFNSNKEWISSVQFSLDTAKTYTLNSNTKYVKLGFRNDRANVNIQLEEGNTATTYEAFGIYDYVNYGNYIVKDVEKQEDTHSYKITCYDKMLYTMIDYENSNITYPITIRSYISAICTKLGLTFKNASDQFANYDKTITNELYLDENGNSLGYTFRDVLDDLAGATASTICINEDDKLEIRYINQTVDKNLFNYKNSTFSVPSNVSIETQDNVIKITTLNTVTSNNLFFMTKIPDDLLENGETYTISSENVSGVGRSLKLQLRNKNGSYVSGENQANSVVYDNNYSLYVDGNIFGTANTDTIQSGSVAIIKNVQVEKGTATSYEPYGETIDEEFLKDTNVNFGEKYGPINTIVLSRSADSDKISLSNPIDLADENKIAIQISDNQIMNSNDRSDYMSDILTKLYGLEYYINDYSSTGICYLDLCDKYNIKIDDKFYPCIMFNDSVEITQGLKEDVFVDMPEEAEQDYKYIGDDDRKVNQVYIIAKKNEGEIEAVVSSVQEISNKEDNNYQEMLNKFQALDETIVNVNNIQRTVTQLQTDTYTKTEIQQIANGTGVNGVKVSAVISTSATFDENGMTYEKTNAPTKTTINEVGINVKDSNDMSLLFAGYVDNNNTEYSDYQKQTIVGTDNIIVKNYLNIGSHTRIQDYENGTGIFWR